MKKEWHLSAGIVLFRAGSEREYLLLRSALTRRPVWEFPKGAIEEGESEREAAQRELREETGLDPADYTLLDGFREGEHYYFTRGSDEERRLIDKRVTYFLARWRCGEVHISHEASRYLWASAADARRLLRFPEKRRVLARAEEWLAEHEAAAERSGLPPIRV